MRHVAGQEFGIANAYKTHAVKCLSHHIANRLLQMAGYNRSERLIAFRSMISYACDEFLHNTVELIFGDHAASRIKAYDIQERDTYSLSRRDCDQAVSIDLLSSRIGTALAMMTRRG